MRCAAASCSFNCAASLASAATLAGAGPVPSSQAVAAKKTAAAVYAYLATARVQEAAFLKSHGGFRNTFNSLSDIAKKVMSENGDPAAGDIAEFNTSMDTTIKALIQIGGRDLQTGTARNVRGQIQETQASRDSSLKMDRQLEDIRNANAPPAKEKSLF